MENWIAIITALGGLGAVALCLREIVAMVKLLRSGVAARESRRRNDIIAQRDAAIAERDAANQRAADADRTADAEREKRIAWREHAGALTWQLRINGVQPHELPDGIEDTHIT